MAHPFWSWWHHSNNFPSGLYWCGLPLFAWNRIAKVFLYAAGTVIIVDIVGPEAAQKVFTSVQTWLERQIVRLDGWRERSRKEITTWLVLLWALFRGLASREKNPQRFMQGRKSVPFGITLIVVILITLSVSALSTLSVWFVPNLTLWQKFAWAIPFFVICFIVLFLLALVGVFALTLAAWLLTVVILRPLDILVFSATKLLLRRVEEKGVASSWRWASLVLLTLGCFIDFLTS